MSQFKIPKRFIPGFAILAQLPTEDVRTLLAALDELGVGVTVNKFATLLKTKLSDKIEDPENLSSAIFSLGSFFNSQDFTIEEVAKDLTEAYYEETQANINKENENELEKKLLAIFNSGAFKLTFKATSLLLENDRNLRSAKIISDVRLVFNDELSDSNRNALIIHRLKIEYEQNGESKEFYVSLDSNDLIQLKNQIERAIEKEKHIRTNYKNIINFIDLNEKD